MSDSRDLPVPGRDSCQQREEPLCRRSRLRASLSVSSALRKVATDVDSLPVTPESVDLRITQGLLSESIPATSSKGSQQGGVPSSSLYGVRRASASSMQAGEPQIHSRVTSTTWSTVSNRVFTSSSRSSGRDVSEFLAEYNRLGSKHGLPQLCHDVPSTGASGANLPPSQPPVSWLFRKLLRRAPSVQTIRNSSRPRLTRNSSVGDIALIDRGRKDALRDRPLGDIARLGGESVFLLPVGSAPGPLVVPSCFSATGMFILQHGMKTPGIFRVPGSSTAINALYDHYSRQFQDAEKSVQQVHQTISSGQIPHHIQCNIYDVTSVFKKFLVGLPGGILGSVPLFKSLRDIHTALFPSPDLPESHQRKVEARLIALAIASLRSEHSVALICAVFGLLNLVGCEGENSRTIDRGSQLSASKDMMDYEALGVVFGPLLLGSKMELVELHSEDDRGGLLAVPESPPRRRGGRRKKYVVKETYSSEDAQVEKARIAAGVAEMLIRSWKEVVRQLRNIGAVDSVQPAEILTEDVAGEDAGEATMEASEYPLYRRESSNFRRVTEATGRRPKRRKSQTHSISDIAATYPQAIPDIDTRPNQSLPAQIQPRQDSNSGDPLGSIVLDNLNPTRASDSLSSGRSPSQQAQHPWVHEALRYPTSVTGSCLAPKHNSGLAEEGIPLGQAGSGEGFSILVTPEGVVAPLRVSIGEASECDDRNYLQQSTDHCSYDSSAINEQTSTGQTGLGEDDTSREVSLLSMANGSGLLAREESPRARGTIEEQGLQDSMSAKDAQPASSQESSSRKTSPHPRTNVEDQLPPQSVNSDGVPLRAGFGLHTRYSPTDQGNISSSTRTVGSGQFQEPEWLFNMGSTASIGEPAGSPAHGKQLQILGDDPQSHAKASASGIDSESNITSGKQTDPLTPGCNIETARMSGATPLCSVEARNTPQPFDISKDQDFPTRSSSISQIALKCPRQVDTTPGKPRSETPIRKPGTASADRLDRLLPPAEEPEVARHINWRNSCELGASKALNEEDLTPKLSSKGNATLYAEIRRLQRLIDLRTEEAVQSQRELEAMRKFKDSGTLSEKLREAQRDLKTWRNRAEWAEKRLLMQDVERRGKVPVKSKDEDVAPMRGVRRIAGLERATMIAALHSVTLTNPSVALDGPNKVIYRRPAKHQEDAQVSLVSGGGSGHEPSFSAFVGRGLLSAAVAGTIFASPSAEQIRTAVVDRVDGRKGVLVVVMNYTGDVLNFGIAVEKAKASGLQVEIVVVGDDVGVGRKKGGKGDFGTSTQGGFASVEKSRVYPNDSDGNLTSEEIEIGMGIHNEPGSHRVHAQLPQLVKTMLAQLLDVNDEDRAFLEFNSEDEVVLLINNLGGVSVLELGGITAEVVAQLKTNYGIEPVRILAGTYMTSLNGLGFSITLMRVVDTGLGKGEGLLELLDAPAEANGWSAAVTTETWSERPTLTREGKVREAEEIQHVDEEQARKALTSGLDRLIAAEHEVTKYDTLVGDGDCGIGLKRGAESIKFLLSEGGLPGDAVAAVSAIARRVESSMDGTSGALYAIFLNALTHSLRGHSPPGPAPITPAIWAQALQNSVDSLANYTPAQPGDRTLIDALHPFVRILGEGGDLKQAAKAAREGAESTKGMKAILGRTVYVGGDDWREVPDPGAVGLAAFLEGLAEGL
ncbi:hypothetical protein GP486_000501 [Trichoglossum hirsutum]|uniref:Dihydroxyacetone kinase n=1 Tax=Trichoglossum hirsutum TaxID=265104 RepID=A0A9P8LHP5_9PEZI|nr:hypothetical protein GP486_000501 [Trichoglossum hirsutum]